MELQNNNDREVTVADAVKLRPDLNSTTLQSRVSAGTLPYRMAESEGGRKKRLIKVSDLMAQPPTANTRKKEKKDKKPAAPAVVGQTADEVSFQNHVGYALGYVACWLEIYGKGLGMPAGLLEKEVGKLLQKH